MKRILVTGSNGLLGQKLTDLYRLTYNKELIATGRGNDRYPTKQGYVYASMDIEKPEEVMECVEKFKPNCIIHTAAMTNVDDCELNHAACLSQNVEAVKTIVEAANSVNAHLIHLSTDFIFDGTNGPLTEDEKPKPLSFYGESKLAAEKIIMEKARHWSIVRTVLVYGLVADMSRTNIVLWAKDSLEKKKPIKVVDDQFRTPTLAEDLALGCSLIEDLQAEGVFNISGKDFMSIFELVERVAGYFKLPMDAVERTNSDTLKQAAKRPPITGFNIDKAIQVLGYAPHSFEEGIGIVQSQFEKFTHPQAT